VTGTHCCTLDIDGVLLQRRRSGMFDTFEVAPGCLEFLEWATARHQCRWLSTRCRQGFPDGSRRAFRLAGVALHEPRWAVLDLIEPAQWSTQKTGDRSQVGFLVVGRQSDGTR